MEGKVSFGKHMEDKKLQLLIEAARLASSASNRD